MVGPLSYVGNQQTERPPAGCGVGDLGEVGGLGYDDRQDRVVVLRARLPIGVVPAHFVPRQVVGAVPVLLEPGAHVAVADRPASAFPFAGGTADDVERQDLLQIQLGEIGRRRLGLARRRLEKNTSDLTGQEEEPQVSSHRTHVTSILVTQALGALCFRRGAGANGSGAGSQVLVRDQDRPS